MITVQFQDGQLLLPLKVTPKGGRDCALPFCAEDVAIKLKVSSPPEDGKANAAVLALMADLLKLPKSRLRIVQGDKSRMKRLAVLNLQADELETLLQRLSQAMNTTSQEAFMLTGA